MIASRAVSTRSLLAWLLLAGGPGGSGESSCSMVELQINLNQQEAWLVELREYRNDRDVTPGLKQHYTAW
jgi:hypothetical protein